MSLAATVTGSGPDLVLLHGLFGAGENLRQLARALGSSCTVHLPDLPNHGDSPHTERLDYGSMIEAVAAWIRLTIGRPVLLGGHSMGGKVAMVLALREPDLVRGLAVLDIAPRSYPPSHRQIVAAMRSMPVDRISTRAQADAYLSTAIGTASVRAFLLRSLSRAEGGYRWKLNLAVLDRDYEVITAWPVPTEPPYPGPALFLGGTESDYLDPQRDGAAIRGLFPHAVVRMIGGAGHWIHSDAPAEVAEHLGAFVETALGSTSGTRR